MDIRKILIPLFLCFMLALSPSFGKYLKSKQPNDTILTPKKPLYLCFGLDRNLVNIAGGYNHQYVGEYNIYGTGPQGWQWVNHSFNYNKLLSNSNFSDYKLSVCGSGSKEYQIGLTYNFGNVRDTLAEPDYIKGGTKKVAHNFLYAGISAMGEYKYYFNRKTKLGPYVYGSVDIGFYTGSDDLFGPGTPLFLQGRVGCGYDFKQDIMIKIFLSEDALIYRETETSQVFQRKENINNNLNAFYIGLGISKTFTLFQD